MTRPKVNEITKIGRTQLGYKESPANSNNTKYGKLFGMNRVPWCAIYSWWKGHKAAKDVEKNNPVYKSASAANIQDLTVKCKGGSWIMKKTSSKVKRQAMARRILPDDLVSFDFGKYDCVRYHTATCDSVDGDYIHCNEGNTSGSGSQSNGGQVLNKKRHYSDICAVVRPKQRKPKPHDLTKKLDVDGNFAYQSRYRMQWWLKVTQDADIGPTTVKALQKKLGIKQTGLWTHDTTKALQKFLKVKVDGDFGTLTIRAFQKYLNNQLPKIEDVLEPAVRSITEPTEPKPAKTKKKTKLQKIVEECKLCAWPSGTPKKKYKYPGGKRRKQYIKDLKKAFGKRSGWRNQTKMGASCDVAVAAVIRSVGIDKKFPRGCDDILKYLKSKRGKEKWKCLKEKNWKKWKPGTVVYQKYNSGAQHIFIYIGNGKVYNAHYVKKTYPIIEKASKIVRKQSRCRSFKVLVPR